MKVLPLMLVLAGGGLIVAGALAIQARNEGGVVIQHGGRERSAIVRTPDSAAPNSGYPTVIVLHGGGGSGRNAEQMTGMTDFARQRGILVVYPNGTSQNGRRFLTWNAGRCCAFAMEQDIDDVGFLSKLIDDLVSRHKADPRRIFVTGLSNGAMMAHRVGVELSDKVRGIAPVAGALNCSLSEGSPVAVLMIHGDADQHVLLEGGKPKVGIASNREDRSMQEGVDWWIKRNRAAKSPEIERSRETISTLYKGPSPVKTVIIKGEGHTWPGGSPGSSRGDIPSRTVIANELIWDFFRALDG